MSTNGETADLMVREGIQITESALKLAGLGAKNLAALLIALANDNQKLAGKTNLKRLIHDGEELTIFSVKQEDLKGFQMEAKRYGVLFYPIVNKVEKTGTVEIMAKAKDAKQINRIFERMGYPAPVKEDIMSLYEQLMGSDKIEPQEKSIIDRSVGNIYREYIKNFQGQPPTLKDLYDDLMKQVNPEAHRIALALELFTVGSLNVFSHQTNINTKSRILCFDIQDLGENLKSVGLLVMLDAIYNRVIQNRKAGKYTHVYIDEIYLFFANGSGSGHGINNYSSEFLYKCWKRFRKYGATLTGITQNVEECLLSNTARMMFANSEFLLMLNQATTDREQLARLLGASDTQMSYVDNAPAGHGLIKVGGAIVPFANELPKNTELYRLMSTKPGED